MTHADASKHTHMQEHLDLGLKNRGLAHTCMILTDHREQHVNVNTGKPVLLKSFRIHEYLDNCISLSLNEHQTGYMCMCVTQSRKLTCLAQHNNLAYRAPFAIMQQLNFCLLAVWTLSFDLKTMTSFFFSMLVSMSGSMRHMRLHRHSWHECKRGNDAHAPWTQHAWCRPLMRGMLDIKSERWEWLIWPWWDRVTQLQGLEGVSCKRRWTSNLLAEDTSLIAPNIFWERRRSTPPKFMLLKNC